MKNNPPQFNCSEVISALLTNDMDSHKIRGTRPLPVSQNSTSDIDLDHVQFDSLKADDKDCWKLKGSMHSSGWMIVARCCTVKDLLMSRSKGHYYYLLHRYYMYVHGTCPSFHRLIIRTEGKGYYKYYTSWCFHEQFLEQGD